MPNGFTIEDFDRKVQAQSVSPQVREARKQHASMAKQTLQKRLKAILDAPVTVRVDGVEMDVPTFEAMTRRMISMVLSPEGLVKDRDRIAAYKVIRDTIIGPPKQTLEVQHSSGVDADDMEQIPSEDLEKLAADMERLLANRPSKTLGPSDD